MSDDACRKLTPPPDGWGCKPVGWAAGKSAVRFPKGDAEGSLLPEGARLCCLEKRLVIAHLAVPKPTQVGRYQDTKARE